MTLLAIHLRAGVFAACGWAVAKSQLKDDPDEVTCRSCWRTKAFAAAEREQFNADVGASAIQAEIMRGMT